MKSNNHEEPQGEEKNIQAEETQQPSDASAEAEKTEEVDPLDKLSAELSDSKDKFLRLYSDFDNYKKRTIKERMDLLKSAGTEIILSMLPVVDDFERAMKSMETAQDIKSVQEGIALIYNKLRSTLEQKGLKEMNAVGTTFDTDLHDAITNAPAPTPDLKGKVIDEVQKGYYLNDKVIRHAKVVIGQ